MLIIKRNKQAGFTLIEMIVVIIIVLIISAIALFQFANNRRGSSVASTAEEIALNIRRAQSMALAVRSTGGLVPSYQNGYGVHFEVGPGLGGPQDAGEKSYLLFTDYEGVPGPGNWDRAYLKNFNPGSPCGSPTQTIDECVEKVNIETGDKITSIEVCTPAGSTYSCSALIPGQHLDITFLRPNLDAYFCTTSPSLNGCTGLFPTIGYVKITVSSTINTTKVVNVWSTGQVSIE